MVQEMRRKAMAQLTPAIEKDLDYLIEACGYTTSEAVRDGIRTLAHIKRGGGCEA